MEQDCVLIYLKQINKIPLLSSEEENELLEKAANGDKQAKNKIVEANLRFVVKIAKEYMNRGFEFEDLIDEGNAGLMIAVDHFKPSMGVHFITYAVWWIRQSISKAISEKSRSIRLPQNRANDVAQIEKARHFIGTDKNEDEQIREIAKVLNLDAMLVRELININRDMKSLDAPVGDYNGDSASFGDFIADNKNATPESQVLNNAMHDDIESVLSSLKPKEERVLRLRYGLNGNKPMSLKEVGDVCGLTKERIRQIEKRAILNLRLPSRSRRLEAYVA